jgi:hypothetical protein
MTSRRVLSSKGTDKLRCLVLSNVAIYGVVRKSDEGAVAHLWQLLMSGQAPIMAFFAIKWLHGPPDRAWGCWRCKPERGSYPWPQCFFCTYDFLAFILEVRHEVMELGADSEAVRGIDVRSRSEQISPSH